MGRTDFRITNTGDSVPGWPKGVARRYLRQTGASCDEDDAAFLALALADKVVQTDLDSQPNLPAHVWQTRDCGDLYDIVVVADPDDFTQDSTNDNDGTYSGTVVIGHQSNASFLSMGASNKNTTVRTFTPLNTASPSAGSGLTLLAVVNGAGWNASMAGVQPMGWPILIQLWATDASHSEDLRRGSRTNGQSILILH